MTNRLSTVVAAALRYHAAGLTIRDAAALAGCDPSAITRAKKRGLMPAPTAAPAIEPGIPTARKPIGQT